MRDLDNEKINLILSGAQLLGSGGGGEIEWGMQLIEASGGFVIKDPGDLSDDALLFIVGAVGGGVSGEAQRRMSTYIEQLSLEERLEIPTLRAIEELSSLLGREPDGFIPTEIGAGNMALTLYAASKKGKYVVNGDCCGRAKPLVSISTTRLAGISAAPLAAVNAAGDVLILKEARDDDRAETILRGFAASSGGVCLCARCAATLGDYKKAMIQDSFGRCFRMGRILNSRGGADLISSLLEAEIGSEVVFRGNTGAHVRNESGGFITGWLHTEGIEKYRGQRCATWFKNEFMITLIDSAPAVCVPDLTIVLREKSRAGVSNWKDTPPGEEVTVFKIPAHPLWHTREGKRIFSLEAVGLD